MALPPHSIWIFDSHFLEAKNLPFALQALDKVMLLSLQCIGTMLLSAHFLVYGVDGIGLKSTHLFGRILEAAAELMFVLLLILIAKGYTVTRARLPQASSIKLAMFVGSYTVIYCTLFIYDRISFDPGQVSFKVMFLFIIGFQIDNRFLKNRLHSTG